MAGSGRVFITYLITLWRTGRKKQYLPKLSECGTTEGPVRQDKVPR